MRFSRQFRHSSVSLPNPVVELLFLKLPRAADFNRRHAFAIDPLVNGVSTHAEINRDSSTESHLSSAVLFMQAP